MSLNPGDIVYWWPDNETDYPSIVELIKPLGEDDGYPEGSWRVQYASQEPRDTEWVIKPNEIGRRVFKSQMDTSLVFIVIGCILVIFAANMVNLENKK